MQYMMLIYLDENSITQQQRTQCDVDSVDYARQLHAEGRCLAVAPLHPIVTATRIRRREGKPVITEGPFAESREQLEGLLINAANLNEALDIGGEDSCGTLGHHRSAPSYGNLLDCLRKTELVDLVNSRSTYQ